MFSAHAFACIFFSRASVKPSARLPNATTADAFAATPDAAGWHSGERKLKKKGERKSMSGEGKQNMTVTPRHCGNAA